MLCFSVLSFTAAAVASADEGQGQGQGAAAAKAKPEATPTLQDDGWKTLNGKWEMCRFGGDGPVEITEDLMTLGFGDPITGVRWTGDHPKDNYELELEARRTNGFDFFAAVTFPVAESHCSLVLGGWGGGVTGISSINGQDAANNDTTIFRNYKNDEWHKIRIRVAPNQITCWVGERSVVDVERKGLKFDIRADMDPVLPLGIANFQCDSEIRKVRIRELKDDEAEPTK